MRNEGWWLRSTLRMGMLIAAITLIAAIAWQAYFPQRIVWLTDSRTLITTDDVNVRSGPGLSFEPLFVLAAESEVVTLGQTEAGFTRVSVDGLDGWVSAAYLQAPGAVRSMTSLDEADTDVANQESSLVSTEADDETTLLEVDQPPKVGFAVAPEQSEQVEALSPTVAPTLEPTSAPVQTQAVPGEKWIEVDRTNRTVTLHNGDLVVARFDALIGKDLSPDGYYSTAVGTYEVWVMEEQLAETPFAEGVYLTHFVGFDPARSNGFHSPTRDEHGDIVYTGGTQTLGCVRLSDSDARQLFEFAHIGMRVEVHD